jgi:peptidyl-prolyl cis-trans isomerase C
MIRVNGITLEEEAILQEMQYHQGADQREAMIRAGESLVIGELVRQRAAELGLEAGADGEFLDALLDAEVTVPEASEEDCRRYYEQNPERFCSSPLVAARHILIAAAKDDETERLQAEDKAKAILEQLKNSPELFAELARQHSSCPSKETGGELGQLSRGQTVPEFEQQLFRCEPGLVPDPIPSRYGFHVAMVDQKVDGRQLPYELVSQRIHDYLHDRVKRKAVAQYIQTLIAEADIEGFDFEQPQGPLLQ